jgi:putative peptide zinc metalloprotease protein
MLKQESIHQPPTEPPRLLEDVAVWPFYTRGRSEDVYIVGSITADRYLTVPGSKLPAVRAFMQQLDGRRTLDQARRGMIREHGVEMDVVSLYRRFEQAGLLAGHGEGSAGDLQRMSATFFRLPFDGLLARLAWLSSLSRPLFFAGVTLIVTVLFFLAADPEFRRLAAKPAVADLSVLRSAAISVLVAALSIGLHELSHCFAAAVWGIRAGTVKVQMYLGLFPVVGLKLAGLYTLPPRGRTAVWGAGIFFNLSATAAALLALRLAGPGVAWLQFALAINWVLVVFNLIPFLPTDGYFLLCTAAQDSNVRVRAWDWMRNPFRAGRQRPSLFVLAYVVATFCLLLSTLSHLVSSALNAAGREPNWRSGLSILLLALFLFSMWRAFRRREESR